MRSEFIAWIIGRRAAWFATEQTRIHEMHKTRTWNSHIRPQITMDKPVPSLLAQWRAASNRVFDAHRQFFSASMLYASGRGPKPSEDSVQEVTRLQAAADALLQQVMTHSHGDQRFHTRTAPADEHTQH